MVTSNGVNSPVVSQYVNSQTGAVTKILANDTTAQSKTIIGISSLQTSGIGAGSGSASQLGYSFQGNYYDSPMIYSATLTGLVGGTTYYYKPSDNCGLFSFVMPYAPGNTPSVYPMMIGVMADVGTTAVSALTIATTKTFKPMMNILVGDLSYADGWVPIWDTFGNMFETLGASVPTLFAQGNHELGSTENSQSYNARYPAPYMDSKSPTQCYYAKGSLLSTLHPLSSSFYLYQYFPPYCLPIMISIHLSHVLPFVFFVACTT